MMLTAIFTKTIRDRWLGWTVAVVSLTLLILYGMAVYRQIDLSILTSMPEAYVALIGIREDVDAGGLAIQAIHGLYGAITLAAMAMAMGASSIASEERDGTIGILLGNPKGRTHVLVSKAGAMVLLAALSVLILWGTVYAIAAMLGVEIGGLDVEALSLHMFVNVLFYGFLATAISAWTGNRGAAAGMTAAVIVLSFFAVGLLPLIDELKDLVKAFPWYYFDGSDPVYNGINWGHLGVLLGGAAVFAAIAVIGVNRRDLKGQSVGVTLIDRLRGNPLTRKIIGQLAGSARVSSIWLKAASEYQGLLLVTAAVMFLMMGIMMGPFYKAIPEETLTAFEGLPEALIALAGGGNISTPEGWYQLETFGLMAPISVMVVTIAIGAGALAGEESRRTIGLLLANPVRRSRIVLEKSWTMTIYAFAVGFATFAECRSAPCLQTSAWTIGNIAATCLLQTLIGLAFGALALVLSAGTGRTRIAVFATIGAAFVLHLANGFAAINESMADVAQWLPFYYYLGNDPLNNGLDWSHAAILGGLAVVMIALSILLFDRRDLRQTARECGWRYARNDEKVLYSAEGASGWGQHM